MTYTACQMPRLDDQQALPVFLSAIYSKLLRGRGPRDHKTAYYLTTFLRLLDKAILDYESARGEVTQDLVPFSPSAFAAIFRSSSHIESCIIVLARAIRFYELIRRNRNAPRVDRTLNERIAESSPSIRTIRNLAEHLYEKDFEGKEIPPGAPISPLLSDDCSMIRFGTLELSTKQLAEVLLVLGEVAIAISEVDDRQIEAAEIQQ